MPTAHTASPPTSTYRLHLTHADTLHDAAALVDHADALGIGWMYASPIQTVPPGATHGYHITGPNEINLELGGEAGLAALRAALDAKGLGLILDIVPNHLGATPDNAWWRDLLRHGPDSAHATTFDVDLGDPAGSRKIVLPFLGATLEEELAAGTITTDGEDLVLYDETRLPLADGTDTTAPIEEILAAQHYALHRWTDGQQILNWRRFFAVNELVGIRVEDQRVFDDTHRMIARPTSAPASATATGSTAPGIPQPASASTPPSCCWTPTPKPSTAARSSARRASSPGTKACSATASVTPTNATRKTPPVHAQVQVRRHQTLV